MDCYSALRLGADERGFFMSSKKGLTAMNDNYTVPRGYAETMDRLNKPRTWDVPGMIADMAENIRRGNGVPDGQVLAAIDWMTFRLSECKSALEDCQLTDDAKEVLDKLEGWS